MGMVLLFFVQIIAILILVTRKSTDLSNCFQFEMMIESVLVARDKFLRPGGIVWPSAASLFLVPVSAAEQYSDSIDFWTAQYGFDLSCLK